MRVLLVICIAAVAGLASGGSALAATPTTSILSGPANGSTTNVTAQSFTFEADMAHLSATFECTFDGSLNFQPCTSGVAFPGAPLPDGPYTFIVRAVDPADGPGDAVTRAFSVDTTAPALNITGGPTGPTNDATPSFTFTHEALAVMACGVDTPAPIAACTGDTEFTAAALGDGPHTFAVQATDAAGNTTTVTRSFTVDTTGPAVTITGGPAGTTLASSPSFSFTAEAGATFECRFDAGAFAACSSPRAPAAALPDGAHQFDVRATDTLGNLGAVASRNFTVHSGAPSASFAFGPAAPLTNQAVTFIATSTDSDGAITENAWDLDNDNIFEATGATASRSFRAPGSYTVRLRSTDEYGAVSFTQRTVVVGNRGPLASFAVSAAAVTVGTPVTFIATSTDSDGPTPAAAWDLSGSGTTFDDGAGASATRTFTAPGSYFIRLRATDADGAADVTSATVTVSAVPVARPTFLSPPPVIRIAGRITSRGVSVTLLSVKVPGGASVEIRCTGRSCPVARYTRAKGASSSLYPLFARRLRAGVVLEIRVTKPGSIGKVTRLRVRRNAAPARTDSCLLPGSTTPSRCPS